MHNRLRRMAAALGLSAGLAASGAGAAEIVVGQVAPLSGIEATQGRAYAAGMQLLFDRVNKSGGAGGHTFRLVRKDDGGRVDDTLAATRELLAQDRPMVLAGFFGGRNIDGLVKSGLLEKERIALVGYRAAEIRPDTPLLYNVRAGLREEVAEIAQHLGTIGLTRLGLFYEEGPAAAELQAAADEAVRKARGGIVARASYPAGGASVVRAVDTLLKATPQAIIMVASGAAAGAFIEQYRQAGGAAQLFATSSADIEQLAKRLGEEQMQGVAIAQVTPSPYRVTSRLSKEFNDAVAAAKPEVPPGYAMLEGYIAARVIVEAARRQGARPTREGFAAALDGIDNLDLGGYVVGFRGGGRHGSRLVELSIVTRDGRIRQ